MRPIKVKGTTIGTGIPKVIVPIMPACAHQALEELGKAAAAGADCVELRLDFCEQARDMEAMARLCAQVAAAARDMLLLVTFRSQGQGGQLELSPSDYRSLIERLIGVGGIDMIDIEIGLGDEQVAQLCALARDAGVIPVVSHHDFEKTPEAHELSELLGRMERLGAGICKFAVMAHGAADALRVMQATEAYAREGAVPLLTMAMGPAGGITRLMGEVFGSSMTFCSLERASAPGQVQIDRARQIMEGIHELSS